MGSTPGAALHVAWALSEVRVRRKFWGDAKPIAGDETLREAARKDWPEWEKGIEVIEVAADGLLRVIDRGLIYASVRGLYAASPQ